MRSGRRVGHSPAALASPSAASWSRSRCASSLVEAGDLGVGRGGGGVQLHGGQPEEPVDRAGRDVDELHPAVGHDGQPPDHHAAADQQVVLAFGVPPGAVAAPEQHGRDAGAGEDDQRRRPDAAGSPAAEPDADPGGQQHDGGDRAEQGEPSPPQPRRRVMPVQMSDEVTPASYRMADARSTISLDRVLVLTLDTSTPSVTAAVSRCSRPTRGRRVRGAARDGRDAG